MSKPTLVQKALNRPSQTYGNIETRQKKDYYSTKQDMIRIAAAAAVSNTHTTASTKLARAIYYPSSQYQHVDDDEDDGDSDLEAFFTPNTSPRTSMASAGSAATITFGGGATRKPSRRSLTNVISAESHLPMVLPLPEQSASTGKSHSQTEAQTSGSLRSTRTPSRSASTSTRTPSTSSPATVSRSASTSTQTRNRHAASSSSLSSTSLDPHSVISSEDAEVIVDQSVTPKAKDKAKERTSHSTPTSQRRDEERDKRQATHQSSTSTSVSNATRPSSDGIGSSTTTTIVIGSSRDAHGKGKERERERNFASASPSASTTTPIPSTTSSTSTPTSSKHNSISYTNSGTPVSGETGTGTISISSKTKYVPPTSSSTSSGRSGSSKTPHTFSAFAAIGSSTGTGSSPASSSTSTPVSSPPHDRNNTSRSTSTPTSSSSTTTPHSLSRKGHIIIGEKKGGEAAFSTTTPKTSTSTTSPKGTNPSANASPSTKTSISSSKTSTQSKIPIPAHTNGGQTGHKNKVVSPSSRSPDANGHARNSSTSSPPSSFPHSSVSSPSTSTSAPPSTVHRKAPPPVLPPLPISYPTQIQNNSTPIQKPGSGQSGLMAMFGMDALMEEEEEEEEDMYSREDDVPDEEEGRSTPRMYSRGQSRAYGSSSSGDGNASTSGHTHTRRAPPKTLSAEVTSLQQTFTSPGERPSKGTQGYTSLVLPRAPLPSASNFYTNGIGGKHPKMQVKASRDGTSGKVDLTKSGVAQSTMASVEVVRGLGERARGKGVFGLLRFGFGGGGKGREKERPRGPMPIHIPGAAGGATTNGSAQGDTADPSAGIDSAAGVNVVPPTSNASPNTTSITPLGFTAYRAPPSYVPSGSVLVQVWAVGMDGVDGRLVGIRFGSGGSWAGLHNGGNETEEEGQTEEETEGDAGGDETELEYETEREGHLPQSSTDDEDGEENIMSTQSTPARPTQPKVGGFAPRTSPQHAKKGRLAALGRSFSLRLAKGANSADADPGNDKVGVHRSASAAVSSFKPQVSANGSANDPSSHKKSLSFSLKRSNTAVSRATNGTGGSSEKNAGPSQPRYKSTSNRKKAPKQSQAAVGYIPGRSFVGRVLECGWEVRDEVVRKGEWVVGLLDVRKAGALAEFIVVDRHRVHRVPHPQSGPTSNPVWAMSPTAPPSSPSSPFSSKRSAASTQSNPPPIQTLTLEELALLPLCGLSAYRAVRTFSFAFSSSRDGARGGPSAVDRKSLDFVGGNYAHGHGPKQSSVDANKADDMMADHGHDPRHGYRRRALVLRGHDGVGAMAVQMLARRGWLVSVHVPCSALPHDASQEEIDKFMQLTEERARTWGADEIIHDDSSPMGGLPVSGAINENGEWDPQGQGADDGRGAAVRLMDMIREDGDVFDAILDTVGGKDVREAGERLLRFQGPLGAMNGASGAVTRNGIPVFKRRGVGQFTTTVGDVPERVVPSAGDNFKAGLRSLRLGGTTAYANTHSYSNESHSQAAPATPGVEDRPTHRGSTDGKGKGKVGYAWVSVAQDVDWEGDDVSETLGAVVRMALEDGVRPVVEDMRDLGVVEGGAESAPSRVVLFEHAPKMFVDNGPLRDGGTVVVRIADY